MKIVILILTLTTIGALIVAIKNNNIPIDWSQKFKFEPLEIGFLIAFLGWMPAPLDVSIWQSLWSQAKQKQSKKERTLKTTLLDFNVGYVATLILGVTFLSMGALVMHHSEAVFSNSALGFGKQLIGIYTQNIGTAAFVFIALAAFTTMFSTTITCLDASPRAMQTTAQLLGYKKYENAYILWIVFLGFGTIIIISFLTNQMLTLIKIATISSFLTAPFFAILNYKLITSKHTPQVYQPKLYLRILSWLGVLFLVGFSFWYITTLF